VISGLCRGDIKEPKTLCCGCVLKWIDSTKE
jgi:hypothetical protein